MKRTLLFSAVGMMALVAGAAALAADKTKSEEAFDRLASLKGEWEGQQDGVKISLVYTLTANGSALMEEFRPESCHPLLLGEESTADGHVCHYRCADAVGIFPCSHHRIEIARRLAQYRPYRNSGRQRSFDSGMDLSVQRQEWENCLPLHARTAGTKLTRLRE